MRLINSAFLALTLTALTVSAQSVRAQTTPG